MPKLSKVFPKIDPDYGPRNLLDALDDAGEHMDYSNYHNRMFDYAKIIIRAHFKEHKIRLGMTKATYERKRHKRHEEIMPLMQSSNLEDVGKGLEMINKDSL